MKKFFKTIVTLAITFGIGYGAQTFLNKEQQYTAIDLDTRNAKITYDIGESFSSTNVLVYALQEDQSRDDVTAQVVIDSSNFNNTTTGTYNIIVKFEN